MLQTRPMRLTVQGRTPHGIANMRGRLIAFFMITVVLTSTYAWHVQGVLHTGTSLSNGATVNAGGKRLNGPCGEDEATSGCSNLDQREVSGTLERSKVDSSSMRVGVLGDRLPSAKRFIAQVREELHKRKQRQVVVPPPRIVLPPIVVATPSPSPPPLPRPKQFKSKPLRKIYTPSRSISKKPTLEGIIDKPATPRPRSTAPLHHEDSSRKTFVNTSVLETCTDPNFLNLTTQNRRSENGTNHSDAESVPAASRLVPGTLALTQGSPLVHTSCDLRKIVGPSSGFPRILLQGRQFDVRGDLMDARTITLGDVYCGPSKTPHTNSVRRLKPVSSLVPQV